VTGQHLNESCRRLKGETVLYFWRKIIARLSRSLVPVFHRLAHFSVQNRSVSDTVASKRKGDIMFHPGAMNRPKFKSLVHYVISRRCNSPETLGAVKLNKILWLSDLLAFYERGTPITNVRYIKRQFGPVPAPILPVLRELEEEGVISIKDAAHFGKRKKEYVLNVAATSDFLTEDELKMVNWAIGLVCDKHTAKSISEASHDHVWKIAEDGEEIPLFTVFAKPGEITDCDREWAHQQLESVAA